MYKKIIGIVLSFLISGISQAQKSPLETVKTVGDRVIANTPFEFRMTLAKPSKDYNFVEVVDFGRTFGLGKALVAYATTNIYCEKDTAFTMQVSHNDGLLILVNGVQAYKVSGNHIAKVELKERDIVLESEFAIKLKKGYNQIILKSETEGKNWVVYLQPKGSTIEFSIVKGLKIGLDGFKTISEEVSKLSNWLVCGPFINTISSNERVGLETKYAPESDLTVGRVYTDGFNKVTWDLPKIETMADAIGNHPLWGGYYNWNYHAAGVAWALSILSEATNEPKYDAFAQRYCDFFMEKYKDIEYQTLDKHLYRSTNHHLISTPLLDFTAAPTLPYIYRLAKGKKFQLQEKVEKHVKMTKSYILNEQVRLPDGTFTRETPEKMTTWVDDMFMGIPFVTYAALETKDPVEKAKLFDEVARQVIGFNNVVYDKKANLYMHAQYSTRKVALPHWSRANGWGVFACTEALANLPKNHKSYKKILSIFQKHIAAIVTYQDPTTGLWHNVIDHQETYLETSASAIFTLALARGVNNGWIDKKKYAPIVLKAWKGVNSQISATGEVKNICIGTMSSEDVNYYATRPLADNDSHGLIGLILCGIEVEKMMGK